MSRKSKPVRGSDNNRPRTVPTENGSTQLSFAEVITRKAGKRVAKRILTLGTTSEIIEALRTILAKIASKPRPAPDEGIQSLDAELANNRDFEYLLKLFAGFDISEAMQKRHHEPYMTIICYVLTKLAHPEEDIAWEDLIEDA